MSVFLSRVSFLFVTFFLLCARCFIRCYRVSLFVKNSLFLISVDFGFFFKVSCGSIKNLFMFRKIFFPF